MWLLMLCVAVDALCDCWCSMWLLMLCVTVPAPCDCSCSMWLYCSDFWKNMSLVILWLLHMEANFPGLVAQSLSLVVSVFLHSDFPSDQYFCPQCDTLPPAQMGGACCISAFCLLSVCHPSYVGALVTGLLKSPLNRWLLVNVQFKDRTLN